MKESKVKTAEEQLSGIKNIIAVDNGYSDWNQFLRVDPDGALEMIDTVSLVFSECKSIAPQSRIIELEAKLKVRDENNASLVKFYFESRTREEKLEAENKKLRETVKN